MALLFPVNRISLLLLQNTLPEQISLRSRIERFPELLHLLIRKNPLQSPHAVLTRLFFQAVAFFQSFPCEILHQYPTPSTLSLNQSYFIQQAGAILKSLLVCNPHAADPLRYVSAHQTIYHLHFFL